MSVKKQLTEDILLTRRIIYIENKEDLKVKNKITLEYASRIIKSIQYLNSKSSRPIYLILESDGGSVEAGMKIKDAIESSRSKIIGVATGDVMSIASYIFEVCSERWIVDSSHVFLHPMWVEMEFKIRLTPHTNLSDVSTAIIDRAKEQRDKMRKEQREIYNQYATRIGSKMTQMQVKRLFLAKRALTAKSVLENALADKIIKEFNFDKPGQSI
ncbi:MAG: ATP-dependent Clp protease proteolytic subunit [Candidatus Pacebacteria bacterium]|nr:ATP-dependent Clp protease proteolytic subunit [Candidatus Paceibacterota bacterium]MBP9772735.1 ATP-dependent Clp protease proteolytic subunit [Candidatus Paceibacterota bacterium]QQR76719.1 MAG: ATP-dependent Clp protease proteolytic subunit [Candidatus Nomurabacteria bacterium]